MTPGNPSSLSYLFQFVFGLYMLVTTVVLINLLIAMMSDTYQRIQQQSDVEWKFGLAKLIRSMHRTDMSPSPINLVTTWLVYLFRVCKKGQFLTVKCSLFPYFILYLLQAKNLKLKITLDYKSPQVQKAQACLRKVSLQRKMNILFMIIISAENGLAAPDSANTQLGSSSNFKDPTKIEYVLDWPSVVKKYYNVIKNVPTES